MAGIRQTVALEAAATLLDRFRDGNNQARDRLVQWYPPVLQKRAHGRLPRRVNDNNNIDDLVRIAWFKALEKVEELLESIRRLLLALFADSKEVDSSADGVWLWKIEFRNKPGIRQ